MPSPYLRGPISSPIAETGEHTVLGVVVKAFNFSTWRQSQGSLVFTCVPGQPELPSETTSQKNKTTTKIQDTDTKLSFKRIRKHHDSNNVQFMPCA